MNSPDPTPARLRIVPERRDEALIPFRFQSGVASPLAIDCPPLAGPADEAWLAGAITESAETAGAAWAAPAEDHPLDGWDKLMNLNVRSLLVFAQAVAKGGMIARRSGRIINIASIAGLGGNPPGMEMVAYNTSKGAVVNMTRALAAEWGEHQITVNAIAPGFFPSRMTHTTIARLGEAEMASKAPLGRLGDDDDLKGAVLLFASDAGKHITGQILAVDGGVSAVHGGG